MKTKLFKMVLIKVHILDRAKTLLGQRARVNEDQTAKKKKGYNFMAVS
jgi:hypothetical protein